MRRRRWATGALEQGPDRRAGLVGEVWTAERKGDVGPEQADLVAAVVGGPLVLQGVEVLPLHQRRHAVGELDFPTGAALLGLQDLEDVRLQDVAARDEQVG